MKPLIYGYMRVSDDLEDQEVRRLEHCLQGLAEAEGFRFATTFHECQSGYHGAFDELVEELKRAEAHHVVVPSLDHISRHPILRDHMLMRLELDSKARVWIAEHE